MSYNSSQIFDAYVPVYNDIPETWDEGRTFLVEALREITESLNVKEIGFYLNEELLTGSQFIPTIPQQFRDIFRFVVPMGALAVGVNSVAHNINFDANFRLIKLYISGTDTSGFLAGTITDAAYMDANNIYVTSPRAYDIAFAIVEYIKEV